MISTNSRRMLERKKIYRSGRMVAADCQGFYKGLDGTDEEVESCKIPTEAMGVDG